MGKTQANRMGARLALLCALWLVPTAPASAQVFTSEFLSDPVSEDWELSQQYCEPETWVEAGWYHQQLDMEACPGSTQGGHDSYRRSLKPFNGTTQFFAEFRVESDGDRSEIPAGAPALLVMANDAGVLYHLTVARDLVRFIGHFDLPGRFIEIEPGVSHSFRLELYPDWYAFYIDASVIDEGVPDGPFPAHDPRISWRGKSWYLPCENAWDYIRFGVIPEDGGGDYDSDGSLTEDDFYFFHECITNDRPGIHGGPDLASGPGCRFADFDADSDTDLQDLAAFQNAFGQLP